jgi:hypothetical protein
LPSRFVTSQTREQSESELLLNHEKIRDKIKNGEIKFMGGDGLSIENDILL